MSEEYNCSANIKSEVTADAGNLQRLRDFAALVLEEDPDFFGGEDHAPIEIGDVVRFGETDSNDSDFASLGSLLNIPGLHKILSRAGMSVSSWNEEVFTTWAAIAGPFDVWLQVLDDEGRHDVTADVDAKRIAVSADFEPLEEEEEEDEEEDEDDDDEEEDEPTPL
jgi:hypothetical protein